MIGETLYPKTGLLIREMLVKEQGKRVCFETSYEQEDREQGSHYSRLCSCLSTLYFFSRTRN